jgi:hypothetical protein
VTRLAVSAVLTPVGRDPVDCRTSAEPCVLDVRAGDGDDVAVVPLHFDPTGALLPPPVLASEPSTGLQDGSVVTAGGPASGPAGCPSSSAPRRRLSIRLRGTGRLR